MKNILVPLAIIGAGVLTYSASVSSRTLINIDPDWAFAFGHTDPAKDFGRGTEYFNYLTKANSIHNAGPYSPKFNDSLWHRVDLPFDFVVDLPYDSLASHSHGYKTVGYKYPETSVGWYRKTFTLQPVDSTAHYDLMFDGIFRDSQVWVNGFYLGGEPSGYTRQRYDITPYLNYGPDSENVIAVRSDATFEEGWFYEGGGIYRHVWLEKSPLVRLMPDKTRVQYSSSGSDRSGDGTVTVSGVIENLSHADVRGLKVNVNITSLSGRAVQGGASSVTVPAVIKPRGEAKWHIYLKPQDLKLWSPDSPERYDVTVTLQDNGRDIESERIRTGFRTLTFDPDKGLFVNDRPYKIHGVDQHQDHPGVGAGIPDAVNVYRLKELKKYGINTVRTSHNPFTPEAIAAADSLGIMLVEENRLLGINDYHTGQLEKMIDRDFNHPSVILWSVGNEEWGVEWDKRGDRIMKDLRDISHSLDSTRLMTVATSSGPTVVVSPDVAGYNYIMQNPVEEHRRNYPDRIAFGSEETTGSGTRGVYFDDRTNGHMASLNRTPDTDGTLNRIARGWTFYRDRPWLLGLCYWTGFDYRGEPNPLVFPATGSEFGILDYAGFPKDEAFYLQSQWTDQPVLHILPHWNLEGHEGETIDIWVYSNMDEVELNVNGRNLGRKKVTPGQHVSFPAVYKPGKVTAKGYKNGKLVKTSVTETSGPAEKLDIQTAHEQDGIRIINVTLRDRKGRFAPTACNPLTIHLSEGQTLLGSGNGDPAFRIKERPAPGEQPDAFTLPAFNGHAQFIVKGSGPIDITLDK